MNAESMNQLKKLVVGFDARGLANEFDQFLSSRAHVGEGTIRILEAVILEIAEQRKCCQQQRQRLPYVNGTRAYSVVQRCCVTDEPKTRKLTDCVSQLVQIFVGQIDAFCETNCHGSETQANSYRKRPDRPSAR